MNNWTRLLAMLDQVLGFPNKKKSSVRKVSQDFDEKTNEHVYMLEYRIRIGGSTARTSKPKLRLDQKGLMAYLIGLEKIQKKAAKLRAGG